MSDETVLVTGFPSFRGRKVLLGLLARDPGCQVYVVVPPRFTLEAEQVLARLPEEQRRRVVQLVGDAASMDLGLSGVEYRELAARVQRIHHVAQVTYPGVPREMAERVNVGATREIIELGRLCARLRSIVMYSTALVSGSRTGIVYERELSAGQTFRTVVEETLARAERLMRSAMRELPVCVVRPSFIVGDTGTGEVDRLDGPYLLMMLIMGVPPDLAVPLPTRGDAPLNLVPIDFVVNAALHIGASDAALGRTFHLVDPSPPSVRRVFELVARAGGRPGPSGFIPTGVTRAVLSVPGVSLLAKAPRAFVDVAATSVRYDATNTEDLLADSGISCPPFESYVAELVAHVRQRMDEGRIRYEPPRTRLDEAEEEPRPTS